MLLTEPTRSSSQGISKGYEGELERTVRTLAWLSQSTWQQIICNHSLLALFFYSRSNFQGTSVSLEALASFGWVTSLAGTRAGKVEQVISLLIRRPLLGSTITSRLKIAEQKYFPGGRGILSLQSSANSQQGREASQHPCEWAWKWMFWGPPTVMRIAWKRIYPVKLGGDHGHSQYLYSKPCERLRCRSNQLSYTWIPDPQKLR